MEGWNTQVYACSSTRLRTTVNVSASFGPPWHHRSLSSLCYNYFRIFLRFQAVVTYQLRVAEGRTKDVRILYFVRDLPATPNRTNARPRHLLESHAQPPGHALKTTLRLDKPCGDKLPRGHGRYHSYRDWETEDSWFLQKRVTQQAASRDKRCT